MIFADFDPSALTVYINCSLLHGCMTLRTTPLKSELTICTTGEGGAVAVGVF